VKLGFTVRLYVEVLTWASLRQLIARMSRRRRYTRRDVDRRDRLQSEGVINIQPKKQPTGKIYVPKQIPSPFSLVPETVNSQIPYESSR